VKKYIALLGLFTVGAFFTAGPVQAVTASSFVIPVGTTSGTAQTLTNSQTGTVNGTLKVTSGTVIAVAGTSTSPSAQITIVNNGTLTSGTGSGGGRVIRDQSGASNSIIINNAGGLIQGAGNDVIALNVNGSAVTSPSVMDIENYGTIQSTDGGGTGSTTNPTNKGNQAINLTVATGATLVDNHSTGVIWSTAADGVRPGFNGVVDNDGLIFSNAFQGSSSDGVDGQTDTGITIVNGFTNTNHSATYQGAVTGYVGMASDVAGKTQSTIEGARHGITGGNTATAGGTVQLGGYTGTGIYTMTITNNGGATIQGDNGSGINIDGFGIQGPGSTLITNESVSVTNYGKIIGDGVTGDGDGIDVDGNVTVDNFGSIISKNAVPEATDPPGSIEFSEGITVGGAHITNETGGTIEGEVANGNTQAVGRGITLAGIDHDVNDNSFPIQSIYENSSITNSGTIKGDSESGIAVLGTTGGGYTMTITNNAGGKIEGNNTGVSERSTFTSGTYSGQSNGQSLNQATIELDDAGNNYVITNYGTIKQDNTSGGMAIAMHGASNTLNIYGGAASITGNISGDTAADSTLTINPGNGNSFSYGYQISNFTVKINSDGTNGTVNLTGASTYSGGTTISGGTLQANNTTGSATGSGNVHVNAGGVLSGSGIIAPGAGNGITIASGGLLAPGFDPLGVASGVMALTSSGGGPVLTLAAPVAPNLPAQLSFDLGVGVNPATSVGAGTMLAGGEHLVGSSTYIQLTVDAAGEVVFGNGANPNLISINLLNGASTVLGDYLLFQGGANTDYSNLTVDPTTGLITAGLSLISTHSYSGELFLDHGDIYVDMKAVPEPSTWAMLFMGLGFLGFQYYRSIRISSVAVGK
jgi:hypothetical protein